MPNIPDFLLLVSFSDVRRIFGIIWPKDLALSTVARGMVTRVGVLNVQNTHFPLSRAGRDIYIITATDTKVGRALESWCEGGRRTWNLGLDSSRAAVTSPKKSSEARVLLLILSSGNPVPRLGSGAERDSSPRLVFTVRIRSRQEGRPPPRHRTNNRSPQLHLTQRATLPTYLHLPSLSKQFRLGEPQRRLPVLHANNVDPFDDGFLFIPIDAFVLCLHRS